MASYRFPILVWQGGDGHYTALCVEGCAPAGFGCRAGEAKDRLEEFLAWSYLESPWQGGPDFLDARLVEFKVAVRPEYRQDGRLYPCDESPVLRVPGVLGRQEAGLLICALPTLNLQFYYYEEAKLRELVGHHVRQALQGLTPQQLAFFLPPPQVALDEIVLRVAGRERRRHDEPELPTLQAVAEPLGDPAVRKQYPKAYERDAEVADLVRRLGTEKANVLLVADPGAGKTTVLVEAVRQLERQTPGPDEKRGEAPRPRRRFWQTSAARLIAGMKYLGQWEERCEDLVRELAEADGVLCVQDLLDLVREGGREPANSVAAFFMPYLQRGELRMVGEATPPELDACRRLLPGLADLFQVLVLPPLSRPQAVAVLELLAAARTQELRVGVGRGVIDLIYHLFRRFLPFQPFPGRAAAFLDKVFVQARRDKAGEVTAGLVLDQFVRQTGLPELFLRDELPLDRGEVAAAFGRQVIGHQDACRVAADLVTTFKAGLNDPQRPVGVLLFCGPTGVGKTELARAIARFFFGHGEKADRLVRLDMSEYAGPGSAERLLARPDGQPGELLQKVRQQPFAVVLLDEIEKADPQVFDVLMGAFDEGRLTDRYGRTATFRSAVIVMTSNLGAGKQEALGFLPERVVAYDAEALSFFRPEFFNRIDAIVTFRPLSEETVRAITRKELGEIAGREGLARLGLRLSWTERLAEHLAARGFDVRYGARPLQRAVEELVVTPLARYLLRHPGVQQAELQLDLDGQGAVMVRT